MPEMERDLPISLWVSSDDETLVPEMKYRALFLLSRFYRLIY